VRANFAADLVIVNPNICDNPSLLLDYSPEVRRKAHAFTAVVVVVAALGGLACVCVVNEV
jgi:hypothetical protein